MVWISVSAHCRGAGCPYFVFNLQSIILHRVGTIGRESHALRGYAHDYAELRVLCSAIHRDRPVDAVIGAMDLETVQAAEITAMLAMLFVGICLYLRPSL